MHPGLVDTQLLQKAVSPLGKGIPVDEGSKTVVYLATEDDAKLNNGSYYYQNEDTNERTDWSRSRDEALKLWEYSERAVEKFLSRE